MYWSNSGLIQIPRIPRKGPWRVLVDRDCAVDIPSTGTLAIKIIFITLISKDNFSRRLKLFVFSGKPFSLRLNSDKNEVILHSNTKTIDAQYFQPCPSVPSILTVSTSCLSSMARTFPWRGVSASLTNCVSLISLYPELINYKWDTWLIW